MSVFDKAMADLGIEPRPQQTKLVQTIQSAGGAPVVMQAGTGVGKSYVLLTSAVESAFSTGKPSVVVCPTNALVDQYVNKDAPAIASVTGATFTHLKGRNRYLCTNAYKLREMSAEAAIDFYEDKLFDHGTADLDEIGLPTDEYGCPGSKKCKDNEQCGALAARAKAAKFNVIITNAHVMVWDRRIRWWTQEAASLLPDYGALFVDECHELDAVTRGCLSDEISLNSVVYDVVPQFKLWILATTTDLSEDILFRPDDDVLKMRDDVRVHADRLQRQIEVELGYDMIDQDTVRLLRDELAAANRFLDLFESSDPDDTKYIVVLSPEHQVKRICVDASKVLGWILEHQPSVLLSGTVPTSLTSQLGIPQAIVGDVGHPFDYGRSQLVISRSSATNPTERASRIAQLANAIHQSGGGTLVLFTSWADLEMVMPAVNQLLVGMGDDIPIFLQSRDDPKDTKAMREEFEQHGNAVLAGVRTFFTGIDIPGRALRQVVLWKMPYPVPTLEFQAVELIHGKQVYWDAMQILLVQGIGRLVRTREDRGRVLILDSRASRQRWTANRLTRHLAEFNQTRVG